MYVCLDGRDDFRRATFARRGKKSSILGTHSLRSVFFPITFYAFAGRNHLPVYNRLIACDRRFLARSRLHQCIHVVSAG